MDDIDALLQQYGPPMLIYLAWRAMGHSGKAAAERAGFSPTTGYKRERHPAWAGAFETMQTWLRNLDSKLLLFLVPEVIESYRKALSESDRTVARDVLDRVFGKPSTRAMTEGTAGDLPPLIVYERVVKAHEDVDAKGDEDSKTDDSASPPAGAGGVHRQRDAGSDV